MVIRELARISALIALIILFAAVVIAGMILAAWVLELVVTWLRAHPLNDMVAGGMIASAIILVILYGQSKERAR